MTFLPSLLSFQRGPFLGSYFPDVSTGFLDGRGENGAEGPHGEIIISCSLRLCCVADCPYDLLDGIFSSSFSITNLSQADHFPALCLVLNKRPKLPSGFRLESGIFQVLFLSIELINTSPSLSAFSLATWKCVFLT